VRGVSMIGTCDTSLPFFTAEIDKGPDGPVDVVVWLGGAPGPGVGCPDTLSKVRRLPSGVFSLSGAWQAPRTVRTARHPGLGGQGCHARAGLRWKDVA
jgi:hypothetical protein